MRGKHKQLAAGRRTGAEQQRLAREEAESARLREEIARAEKQADDLSLIAEDVHQRFRQLRDRDQEQTRKLQDEAERLFNEARAQESYNEQVARELRNLAREVRQDLKVAISYDSGDLARIQRNDDLFQQDAIDVIADLVGTGGREDRKRKKFRQWRDELSTRNLDFGDFLKMVEDYRSQRPAWSEGRRHGSALVSLRPKLAQQWRAEHADQLHRTDYIDENLAAFIEWVREHW